MSNIEHRILNDEIEILRLRCAALRMTCVRLRRRPQVTSRNDGALWCHPQASLEAATRRDYVRGGRREKRIQKTEYRRSNDKVRLHLVWGGLGMTRLNRFPFRALRFATCLRSLRSVEMTNGAEMVVGLTVWKPVLRVSVAIRLCGPLGGAFAGVLFCVRQRGSSSCCWDTSGW